MRCYRCGKKDHWKADCTAKLCSRCQGRAHTADACPVSAEKRCNRCNGRGHAADVCPSSKEEAVLAVSNNDCDDGTVQASVINAEEAGECSDVLRRMREGESAWRVDEAWLCDSGASTHMTPSADCMINHRECILKLRIADGSTRSIEGYGDINFVFRSGNGHVQVLLTNVAHMSDLRYHLFCLPTLVKNG